MFHIVSLKVLAMLAEAKYIISDSDWTDRSSPQTPKRIKTIKTEVSC